MLRKADIDKVIIQADYQSGDRYTIASALQVDPRLGVMIMHPRDNDAAARGIQRLYSTAPNAEKRIILAPIPPKENTARNRKKYKGKDFAKVPVEQHYTNATTPHFIDAPVPKMDASRSKMNFAFDNPQLIEDGIKWERVSAGTYQIGAAFRDGSAPAAHKTLRDFWSSDKKYEVGLWLNRKGFDPTKSYVFLFAKSGERTAQKAHHFTSILTWRLLVDDISRDGCAIPVVVGDKLGIRTSPSLVEFWNDDEWKAIFDGAPTRADQLGLWSYFANNYGSCSIIGMRSGAIEVPALMGIRTRYIEERGNGQAERMASWLGNVPTWSRQIVERAPGIVQQKYQADYRHTRDATAQEAANASAIRYGAKPVKGPATAAEAQKLINAVFERDPLTETTGIDPKQFMIQPDEFESLMTWIRAAPARPAPIPIPRADMNHDATVGRATESAMAAMREKVAKRDWSLLP